MLLCCGRGAKLQAQYGSRLTVGIEREMGGVLGGCIGAEVAVGAQGLGKIVDCGGRMPGRTSVQPMVRRARHRKCRITWVVSCPNQTKTATEPDPGLHGGLGLLVPSMGPTPLRGASLRLSEFVPDKFVERGCLLCPNQNKKTAQGRSFCFGWETRIRT